MRHGLRSIRLGTVPEPPRLAALHEVTWLHNALATPLPVSLPGSPFVVVRAGSFGGLNLEPLDILLCSGTAADGDALVLVARGHGRPRLGVWDGQLLRGDQLEP